MESGPASPPPPAGWYPDPEDPSQQRYWTGSEWSEHRAPAAAPSPAPSGTGRRIGVWGWIGIGVLVIVIGGALLGDEEDDGGGGDGGGGGGQSQPAVSSSDSPEERVAAALEEVTGPVEDPEVSDVEVNGDLATATVQTPGGGFEGASIQDLDWLAGAVFADVYDEAEYTGDTLLTFRGGLVDSRTGEDVPNAQTARYEVNAAEAKRIDWSDEDAIQFEIDWSFYRPFVHPAIKD